MKAEQTVVTVAGLNHQTSPVEEREQLAFSPEETAEAVARLGDVLGGAVLLSTCNRTEVYATMPEGPTHATLLISLLNGVKGTAIDESRFYSYQHDAAARHLFRVSAGIDSMVLGESQILGQVREAMSAATQAGTLNGTLSKLFHSAIGAGKRARTETQIGRHAVSVGSAAVALARKRLGNLAGKTVLVIRESWPRGRSRMQAARKSSSPTARFSARESWRRRWAGQQARWPCRTCRSRWPVQIS